jgi:aspartyl-tRNA(Asn)/glutamyl-tRNA(Gln) amidotransferase subunit A
LTPQELQRAVDERSVRSQIPATELAQAFLDRIAERDSYNAVLTPTPELALADARRADEARDAGKPLPLDGLPMLIKDNIDVAGVRCTVGSKLFFDRVAQGDATVVARLREAGAIILGKTFLHEFAFGVTSNGILGACRNPWDPARIPGGSSGGSGAAIAADFAIAALGTDTGGSVRLPAAIDGVTGLRPTFAAVSNRGVFPLAPSFDTVGPLARSAGDLAAVFAAMRGYDPLDPWSQQAPPMESVGAAGVRGLRIAIVEDFFFDGIDSQIEHLIRDAGERLRELGAQIFTHSLEGVERAYRAAMELASVEAAATYETHLDDPTAEMGQQSRERFAPGRGVAATAFARDLEHMMRWRRRIARLLTERFDVVLTPAVAVPTFAIDGITNKEAVGVLTRMTYPWSFAGVPAISIPCGFTFDHMPVGVQLVAAPWRDDLLLSVAEAYQRVTDWHRRRPDVPAKAVAATGVN